MKLSSRQCLGVSATTEKCSAKGGIYYLSLASVLSKFSNPFKKFFLPWNIVPRPFHNDCMTELQDH